MASASDPEVFAPGVTIIRNVTSWSLTRHGDGDDAVVIAPGGAFHFLAIEHEGHEVARRLVDALGVSAYVLQYRTVATPADDEGFRTALARIYTEGIDAVMAPAIPAAAEDGGAALADVRTRHDRVALVGFSAGARMAVETLLSDAPPDAAALIYPPPVDVDASRVPAHVPLFTLMAADDPLTTAGAESLHRAWRAAGGSSALHLFAEGAHGFGTNATGHPVDRWLELLTDWLRERDFGSVA